MGKVTNKRHRHHSSAAQSGGATDIGTKVSLDVASGSPVSAMKPLPPQENVFSKLDIDTNALQRELTASNSQDFDNRSRLTSKSFRGLNMTKKDKKKLKQMVFMKKIEGLQTQRKEEKEVSKRKQTAVVGDMKPLHDTLPTLELLMKETQSEPRQKQQSKKLSSKAIKKEKTRQKDMMSDVSVFHQVLNHPSFKADPLATIREHLSNKVKEEEDMAT